MSKRKPLNDRLSPSEQAFQRRRGIEWSRVKGGETTIQQSARHGFRIPSKFQTEIARWRERTARHKRPQRKGTSNGK